jgi:hypothetical protein
MKPKDDKPHHMHALTKGSAKHLFNHGHIDRETHDEIVAHAEKGMRNARKAKERE